MLRNLGFAGFALLIGLALWCGPSSIEAQAKKEDLKKQNQQLKKSLAERDQRIQNLNNQIQQLKADLAAYKKKNPAMAHLQRDLDLANQSAQDKDDIIAALKKGDLSRDVVALRKKVRELGAIKNAPFVHTKILRLKKMNEEQVKNIQDEASKTLAKIEGVRAIWIGKPAENTMQKGYHLGVIVLLDDPQTLQKFLDDPLHKQFTDKMANYWERPLVYDIQRVEKTAKEGK